MSAVLGIGLPNGGFISLENRFLGTFGFRYGFFLGGQARGRAVSVLVRLVLSRFRGLWSLFGAVLEEEMVRVLGESQNGL